MTVKAIVFDAYGTQYDVQSVAASRMPRSRPWRLHHPGLAPETFRYTWLRSLMRRYEDFLSVTRDALSYTLGALDVSAAQTGRFRLHQWL